MKKTFLAWPSALALVLLSAAAWSAGKTDRELNEIRQLQKNGQAFEALQKVEAARRQDPGNPALLFYQRLLREKVYPKSAAVPLVSHPGKAKKTETKDSLPPRLEDRTARRQTLIQESDALEIQAEISDPSGVKEAAVLLPATPDVFCRRLPLLQQELNLYRARIPGWCVGKAPRLSYRLEAVDQAGNRGQLGQNPPLEIDLERPLPKMRLLLGLLALLLAATAPLLWKSAARRVKKKEAEKREEAVQRAAEQQKTAGLPPPELEVIETLDPSLLAETEDRRASKFFERRRRLWGGGRKKKS